MGTSAVSNVLVHALGVGDEPRCAFASGALLADAGNGRKGGLETVAGIRADLGHRRSHEYLITCLPTRFRTLDLVSPLEAEQAFSSWNHPCLSHVSGLYHAMAHSQLPHFRTV